MMQFPPNAVRLDAESNIARWTEDDQEVVANFRAVGEVERNGRVEEVGYVATHAGGPYFRVHRDAWVSGGSIVRRIKRAPHEIVYFVYPPAGSR